MAKIKNSVEDAKKKAQKTVNSIDVGKSLGKVKGSALAVKDKAVESVMNIKITPEEIIAQAAKLPIARVDRSTFLRKELIKHFPEEMVQKAIDYNPAYAGIDKYTINNIANQVIQYETNKVSGISFAAGIPGGAAMAATLPADIAQYFAFTLRTMQEIAYLYGFEAFDFDNDSIDSNTMNEIMIFLGVMFGVQSANSGVKIIAQAATQKVSKTLANKALTKTTIYPIVKKVAQTLGLRMTKQIFAEGVSKVVPVVGGVVAGGITYATFKPNCLRLKHSFWNLNLCDVDFYEKARRGEIQEMPEDEIIEVNEDEIYIEANSEETES